MNDNCQEEWWNSNITKHVTVKLTPQYTSYKWNQFKITSPVNVLTSYLDNTKSVFSLQANWASLKVNDFYGTVSRIVQNRKRPNLENWLKFLSIKYNRNWAKLIPPLYPPIKKLILILFYLTETNRNRCCASCQFPWREDREDGKGGRAIFLSLDKMTAVGMLFWREYRYYRCKSDYDHSYLGVNQLSTAL